MKFVLVILLFVVNAAFAADMPFFPEIKYNLVKLTDKSQIERIQRKYKDSSTSANWRKALRTLNRKELRFWRVGQNVIVPDTAIGDMRAYSIFPLKYTAALNLPQLIVIDIAYQSYGCYENGVLVRFAACCSGNKDKQTPSGRYSLNWKKKVHCSSEDSTWIMPHTFNFHRASGMALHQYSMPGRPSSHSCVRQFPDDAEWMFNWGKTARMENNQYVPGTPLIIINSFDFERKQGGPWLDLTSNKDYWIDLPSNPMEVEKAIVTVRNAK